MINNKKARERQFFDEVAKMYPAFPKGKIIEAESPDFRIHQDTQIIGVEIVDYVRGQNKGESAERRNEVLWQKIANAAKSEFESMHSDPLLIRFLWNHRYFLRLTEIPQMTKVATNLIETHIPTGLFENIRIGSDELEGTLLEDVCYSITVTRVRNFEQSLWNFLSSGFIEVQADELQYLIDLKNDKMPEYLMHCNVVWLIIVADGRYISSNISLSSLTKNNVYSSMFEQVLVYDRISKNIFPLEIRRA